MTVLKLWWPTFASAAVAAVVIFAVLWMPAFVAFADAHVGLAAWVQAFGTVVAIIASVWTARFVDLSAERRQLAVERRALLNERRRYVEAALHVVGKSLVEMRRVRDEYRATSTVQEPSADLFTDVVGAASDQLLDFSKQTPDILLAAMLRNGGQQLKSATRCASRVSQTWGMGFAHPGAFESLLTPDIEGLEAFVADLESAARVP